MCQMNKLGGFQGHRLSYNTGQLYLCIKDKKDYGTKDILKVSAWNIRGLGQKEQEMKNALEHQKVNIAIIITEMKNKLKSTGDIGDWAMICSGVEKMEGAEAGVLCMWIKSVNIK